MWKISSIFEPSLLQKWTSVFQLVSIDALLDLGNEKSTFSQIRSNKWSNII